MLQLERSKIKRIERQNIVCVFSNLENDYLIEVLDVWKSKFKFLLIIKATGAEGCKTDCENLVQGKKKKKNHFYFYRILYYLIQFNLIFILPFLHAYIYKVDVMQARQ